MRSFFLSNFCRKKNSAKALSQNYRYVRHENWNQKFTSASIINCYSALFSQRSHRFCPQDFFTHPLANPRGWRSSKRFHITIVPPSTPDPLAEQEPETGYLSAEKRTQRGRMRFQDALPAALIPPANRPLPPPTCNASKPRSLHKGGTRDQMLFRYAPEFPSDVSYNSPPLLFVTSASDVYTHLRFKLFVHRANDLPIIPDNSARSVRLTWDGIEFFSK